MKDILNKIKLWWNKMFGIEVKNKEGIITASLTEMMTATDKTIKVSRKTTVRIIPSDGISDIAYITSGGGMLSGGFNCTHNDDNSLTVSNSSNEDLFISIMRY